MPRLFKGIAGQYRPGATLAHVLDARVKVLVTGLLSVAVWSVEGLPGLGLMAAVVAVWLWLLRDAARRILDSLAGGVIYIFVLALLYYSWTDLPRLGLDPAAVAAVLRASLLITGKLGLTLAAAYWLYFSTAPMKVVEAIGALLRPLERLRLPVGQFAFTVGLVIRFFPASLTRLRDLHRNLQHRERLAAAARGKPARWRRTMGRVIDTMVLYMQHSLHDAELLSLSLMARGYDPYRPLVPGALARPGARDLVFLGLSIALILLTSWRL